jgi:hypothetical protein
VRQFALFVFTLALFLGIAAVGRTMFGADVGEPCSEMLLSCRATRGVFSVNACVRTGPDDDDTFCSYACTVDRDCPTEWTCAPAGAWSNVPGTLEEVEGVCSPPH